MSHKPRVLYLAHGRAGYECLNILTGELAVPKERILGFSYRLKESIPLVQRFEVLGIRYSTERLTDPESRRAITQFDPELIVSIHCRDIVPSSMIQAAALGGFNLHPSLLPKYRGCFSGPWAILHQEAMTGVSYHYLTKNVDEGALIVQVPLPIAPDETGFSLFGKLVDLGVRHFAETFRLVVEARYPGEAQVGIPSYFKRAVPHGGIIDPTWDLRRVDAFIRALYFPGFRGAMVETHEGLREVTSVDELVRLRDGICKS